MDYKFDAKPIKLELGKEYTITFKYGNFVKARLIKTTKLGYNMLNEKTNKCVFKKCLYASKCENHLSELFFFIHNDTKIIHNDTKIR